MNRCNKRGQVTLFIILAIVIVAGIILFFTLKPNFIKSVPEDMRPIYDYYLSCMEEEVEAGIVILGEQGGYINLPDFEAGSPYNPLSSQLSFFGQAVPYWMYISGNNFLKEQVPTRTSMERELSNYINERYDICDFSDFEKAGFDIYIEEGTSTTVISEESVDLKLNNKITIFKDGNSIVVNSHILSVKSKLGRFFEMALKVFEKAKNTMFFEDYAIDVMRLYAPVDGVELSCAPKIFVDEEIRSDLYDGLELNMNSIKFEGGYYDLSSENRKYFVKDLGFSVEENVNIMYNRNWPTKIEIFGDRVVKPVGTQEGLSAIGFCYTPYHLVYDISFPVMIQFYDAESLFQFPMAVIIDNSQPRKSIPAIDNVIDLKDEVCQYMTSDVEVYTYDNELNPVEASLTFKCLGSMCNIGETKLNFGDAVFEGKSPACVNGFIIANAEGYNSGKTQISTNSNSIANILLLKEYELELEVNDVDSMAVVSFTSEDYSTTVIYPEMDTVKLIEGYYNISVFVYSDSTLKFSGNSEQMCVDVPVSGIGGFLGLEEEKCYDVDMPAVEVNMAVIGGGKAQEYIAESMLKDSIKLNIDTSLLDNPNSIDELQENYVEAENGIVFLEFE